MNTLRPDDIYCDNTYSPRKAPTSNTTGGKIVGPISRPTKLRKKPHRKCLESKLKIRRNLFGPVDHENTENFLKKELDILSDLSNKKWNFDFGKEKPLDGPWLWQPVGPRDPTVPIAYRGTVYVAEDQSTMCDEVKRSCPETATPLGLSTDNVNVSRNNNSSLLIESSCGRKSKSCGAKRKALQPTIKGFLTVKKTKPLKHHDSLEKTRLGGAKDNTIPTFLHIIKSVSATQSFSCEDNIAL